jgi:uncharacterized protein YlzI (FlbEa/FlbD family)
MLRLTSTNGTAIYFAAPAVSIVMTGPGGTTTVAASGEFLSVRESVEDVVRMIAEASHPAAEEDYAPLVDAARRMVAWMDTPTPWAKGTDLAVAMQRLGDEHDRIVESLRSALAALPKSEVGRG